MGRTSRTETRTPSYGIVLDTGAAFVHVGLAYQPDVHTIPNAIARTRPGVRRQVLVGDLIESDCLDYGGLQLRLPMDRGMIVDWAAQKNVWDRALVRALGCASDTFGALRGRTVIVTEPYFLLPEQQKAFDALLFDWYEADAIWRAVPAQLVPWALMPRSEAMLVVDLGHSYTHAVPIVHNAVQWDAVRRLDIGGRVLTHILKTMFSYRQWNMMDETYLTDKMKAATCFVAACEKTDEPAIPMADRPPHTWSFAQLVDLFHTHKDNDVVQQYVLPDYATPDDVADPATKYGYIVSGPPAPTVSVLPDEALDDFIASPWTKPSSKLRDEHQVLRLGQERYQLFEYLFAPDRLGLDQAPLPELIADAIQHTDPSARDMLWSNVVLIGGSARVPGLVPRLQRELRMWAPDDVPVAVHRVDDPMETPVRGAQVLLQSPPTSDAGKFLSSHLVTRQAYQQRGGSQAPPGERGGTALGDERFGSWTTSSPTS